MELYLDMDLYKAMLNKGKLVKRMVVVRRKDGKTFSQYHWVDPNDQSNNIVKPEAGAKDETTYKHHNQDQDGLERRLSNKFPVTHLPAKDLKNTIPANRKDVDEAIRKYHAGEDLDPVYVDSADKRVMKNYHIYEAAKELGLSHVPAYVMGNPILKKQLEDAHTDQARVTDEDTGESRLAAVGNPSNRVSVSTEYVDDVSRFEKVITKRYTKSHIMAEAKRQGITWNENMKSGEKLEDHNQIMWMRAYQAIVRHIADGKKFEVEHIEKDVDENLKNNVNSELDKHFLEVLDQFNGKRSALIDWCLKNNIEWKRDMVHPQIDWMRCAMAVKKRLAAGQSVKGVRVRSKELMENASVILTPQIKEMVKALATRHGKDAVIDRARKLGIVFAELDSKGNPFPANMLWMRASEAIQKYVAKGKSFTMSDNEDPTNGMTAKVGDYGSSKIKFSKYQKVALDTAKRNSQQFEKKAQAWGLKSIQLDNPSMTPSQVNDSYKKFVENARTAPLMVHFDPFEEMKDGSLFIDRLSTDGIMKNNYDYGRVEDPEELSIKERELFGEDYDDAPNNERPIYGVLDLFKNGLGSMPYGSVALVLNDDAKKRTTGTHTDSQNLDYETNGKLTRSAEDPHHLLCDRWVTKWSNPNKADARRKNLMNAVISGKQAKDDDVFEAQVHGGIDMKRDVDHLLVHKDFLDDDNKEMHQYLDNFSKQFNIPIKYWSEQ